MAEILKGKPVADAISAEVKSEAEALRSQGIVPGLMIVRVGERADDLAYENAALKRMRACAIDCTVTTLPEAISQEQLIEKLSAINADVQVHGILLFRPLPAQIDEKAIQHGISPEKDIDCFNPVNLAKIVADDASGFPPCTPAAAIEILKHYRIPLKGKRAVVIGRSLVVGKPLAMLLLKENATVTICHSRTEDLPRVTVEADVLIAAIGRARMITDGYIKEGATVIDVGINLDDTGNLCGDVDTEKGKEKAAFITPVPGGVGSVTTAVLARHVLKACKIAVQRN